MLEKYDMFVSHHRVTDGEQENMKLQLHRCVQGGHVMYTCCLNTCRLCWSMNRFSMAEYLDDR